MDAQADKDRAESKHPDSVPFSAQPAIDAAVGEVLSGNTAAFRDVVELTQKAVRVSIAMIIPDPHKIDDIAQEVYLRVFDRLADYRPGTNFTAWIKAFARNAALNERKQYLRRKKHMDRLAEESEAEEAFWTRKASGEPDLIARLFQSVADLPPLQREIIERFYFGGEASKEIAADLGLSDGAIRVQLHRARMRLLEALNTLEPG